MARSLVSASSQYLERTSFLAGALPCTIACWFRATSTSGFQRVATWSDFVTTVVCGSVLLNYPSAGDVASQVAPGGGLPYKSGFTANTWHHACSVTEPTAARVYLDGVVGSDVTYSAPSVSGATYFTIGKVASTQYFDGRVCHVAVWSVALNAAEAARLAAGFCPLLVRPASLIAYYPLGGFHGDYDRDLVGGYNLTLSGAPTFADQCRIIYPQGPHGVQLASGGSPPAASPWLYARRSARIIGGGLS
jgi:hypothetical protein